MPGVGRRLVVVVTVVLAAVTTALPAAARGVPAGPKGDAFYQPPDPLPKAKPGTVIRARSIAAPTGARAWRVLYHSRTVSGADIAVSGIVVAPAGKAPKGGRPVVTWAHGTTGLADACAPSRFPNYASMVPYVTDLLHAGYVVAATDYEGLGTPGLHPYLVGESEGRGVLDAARAAEHVDGAGAGRDVIIAGHSQGGHAALFAGELAASYAGDLHLLGVVAAAPAADLEVILPAAGAIKTAGGFTVMAAEGFHAAYPDADPAIVLTKDAVAGASIVDRRCSGDVIRQYAGGAATVLRANPLTVAPWARLIHENSDGNQPAGAPVLIVQGAADPLVVRPLTDAFVKKACALGDKIDYRVYPGADHGSVINAAHTDVLEWIAKVVDGAAVPSTCP